MSAPTRNVLFLCTGNSARSILSEAILNRVGAGRFVGYSAGSQPVGKVNPYAIQLLEMLNIDTGFARSKNWDEFADNNAPVMDFIITVCDNAAGESCPIWPGNPASAHWGIPDPAAATGRDEEILAAFEKAYNSLENRILRFVELPFGSLDEGLLRQELQAIGNMDR